MSTQQKTTKPLIIGAAFLAKQSETGKKSPRFRLMIDRDSRTINLQPGSVITFWHNDKYTKDSTLPFCTATIELPIDVTDAEIARKQSLRPKTDIGAVVTLDQEDVTGSDGSLFSETLPPRVETPVEETAQAVTQADLAAVGVSEPILPQ